MDVHLLLRMFLSRSTDFCHLFRGTLDQRVGQNIARSFGSAALPFDLVQLVPLFMKAYRHGYISTWQALSTSSAGKFCYVNKLFI